jgi:hypothetical protein
MMQSPSLTAPVTLPFDAESQDRFPSSVSAKYLYGTSPAYFTDDF